MDSSSLERMKKFFVVAAKILVAISTKAMVFSRWLGWSCNSRWSTQQWSHSRKVPLHFMQCHMFSDCWTTFSNISHPINEKEACKEVNFFHVNWCSSSIDDNPWRFLGVGHHNKFIDHFCFEGPLKTPVYSGKVYMDQVRVIANEVDDLHHSKCQEFQILVINMVKFVFLLVLRIKYIVLLPILIGILLRVLPSWAIFSIFLPFTLDIEEKRSSS